METAKLVKLANDSINSDERIKEYYPDVKEIYIQPLDIISMSLRNDGTPQYDFNKCKFHIHLTVPFSEFYKDFLKLYKSDYFSNRVLIPLDSYLFEKYQIDTAFLIDYYVLSILKSKNIFFDTRYKVDIYTSDGKDITPLGKIFSR